MLPPKILNEGFVQRMIVMRNSLIMTKKYITYILPSDPNAPELLIQGYIESCHKKIEYKFADFNDVKKSKINLSFLRFSEYITSVEKRKSEFESSMNKFIETKSIGDSPNKHNEAFEERVIDFSFLQLDIVNKIESFHQHVYATLSAFVMLLIQLLPRSLNSQIPINSINKFLKFLKKTNLNELLKDDIDNLLNSITFRAKFIDHPQQHAAHNWMTWRAEEEIVILYFIPLFTEEEIEKYYQKHKDKATPPFEEKSMYISPYINITYKSLKIFIENILENLETIRVN